jgi:hypothetical protein
VWTTTPDSDVLEPTIRSPVGGKAVAEETFTRAEQDREDPEPVFVDEALTDERPCEPAAPVDLELAAAIGLETFDLGDEIAGDDRRWPPRRVGEGRRHDVLRQRVEVPGEHVTRVGDVRPVRRQHLVAPASEEDAAGLLDPLDRERSGRRIHVGDQPAAHLEAATAVFVGGSGALHHAIHRRERRQHQSSHTDTPLNSAIS